MSIRLIVLALSGPLAVWLVAYPLEWAFTRQWFGEARPLYWGIITVIFIVPPLFFRFLSSLKAALLGPLFVYVASSLAFLFITLIYRFKWVVPERICGFTCNFYTEAFLSIFTAFWVILSVILMAGLMAWRRWGAPIFDRIILSYSTRARADQ